MSCSKSALQMMVGVVLAVYRLLQRFFYFTIIMYQPLHRKNVTTQPHHDSLDSHTHSTIRNNSELIAPSHPKPQSRNLQLSQSKNISRVQESTDFAGDQCYSKELEKIRLRKKYRQVAKSHARKRKEPELTSPHIGLKVRRVLQNDFNFHEGFSREEVLNYFSSRQGTVVSRRGNKVDEYEFLRKEGAPKTSTQQSLRKVKEYKEQRLSSQLSGWGAGSDIYCRSSAALDAKSYQIVSNFPSISVGLSQKESQFNFLSEEECSFPVAVESGDDLPEYSIKIIQPSELTSAKDLISIKVINESAHGVGFSRSSNTSHSQIKTLVSQTKSEVQLDACNYSMKRQKVSYEQIQSNKENHLHMVTPNSIKRLSEQHSEVAAPHQRPTTLKSQKQFLPVEVGKETVLENSSNCNRPSSNINPSKRKDSRGQKEVAEEANDSEMMGSILAIKTLNSHIDLSAQHSPCQFNVHIREPTMLETQPWGLESLEGQERLQTVHEAKAFEKDFASEVRLTVAKDSKKESFYSQELLQCVSVQMVSKVLEDKPVNLRELVSEQIQDMVFKIESSILNNVQPKRCELRDQVAESLELLESQILDSIVLN